MIKGCDTAARLNADQAAQLRELGYEFILRYCVPTSYSKAITAEEADALLSAGFAVGLCWETTASRAKGGAVVGLADGRDAKKCAEDLGAPEGTVIYFAVDYDAPQTDMDKIAAYMTAAASVCAPYRLGIYGPYSVIEDMAWREIGDAYWQCVGWSGGKVSPAMTMYQKEWNIKTPVTRVDNNYTSTLDGFWRREAAPMFYSFSPAESGIYVNKKKKTILQIQAELGCDIICNLNLFNSDFSGACYTRADGKVVGTDGYGYYGFGWNRNDKKLTRAWSGESKHENFFGCYDIIQDGMITSAPVPTWTNGYRRRTVIGMTKDGKVFVYCNSTVETANVLAATLLDLGAVEATVLDGGGSTQCMTPGGNVVSSDKKPRIVHTLYWANLSLHKPKCPYSEPQSLIRKWSVGEGAKWVQWMLNQHGAKLTVDGFFYSKSVAALKVFQTARGLDADGICGPLTRAELKK